MFETWLTTWLLGVAAVVSVIAASWSLATYRKLKQEGAPEAGRILRRLWFSPVASLLRIDGRADRSPEGLAWVWWDVRWGPSGQTKATIQGADGAALHLSLAKPVELYSAAGELLQVTDMRFVPSKSRSYTWGVPTGVLEPVNSTAWQRAPGDCPTARLCVLTSSTA
jgi:hypothetical protein